MSEFNRCHNSKNPFQGEAKRVLCVCSAGLLRSPTAANVLHRELGYNTRAAGISLDYALVPVDTVLMYWADEIVFMQQRHLDALIERYPELGLEKKSVVLEIPDNFQYMEQKLQGLILERYKQQTGK